MCRKFSASPRIFASAANETVINKMSYICVIHSTLFLEMTASEFKTRWERELGKYLQERDPSHANGKYRGACHQYIIDCDEQDKLSLIVQDNILDDVLGMRQDFKDLIGKPHKAAHFLNSSQIVCYNFFRRMMGNGVYNDTKLRCYGHPTAEMLSFVKQKIGAEISSSAKCVFEYEDKNIREEFRRLVENGKGEKSNYDFYIEDGDIRIFLKSNTLKPHSATGLEARKQMNR
jgi:hypothetical protein